MLYLRHETDNSEIDDEGGYSESAGAGGGV